MTLTSYVVINKTKYEVCISLKNHLVKSWHHHNAVNFSSFMMGKFVFKNELFFRIEITNERIQHHTQNLIDIKFHIFDMHILISPSNKIESVSPPFPFRCFQLFQTTYLSYLEGFLGKNQPPTPFGFGG